MIYLVCQFVRRIYWRFILPIFIRQSGLELNSGIRFYGRPNISLFKNSKISIGKNCKICSDYEMTALDTAHPVILRTLAVGGFIEIGENTGLSGTSICAASSIRIGKNCLIGANVIIADTDFHPVDNYLDRVSNTDYGGEILVSAIEICDNVFIGANAIILKGVRIGVNSVIGAGSVVASDVESNSIYAGNPARLIRKIHEK